MGLDLVELVMAVEERFQVAIPDADAVHLTTPRKLIDFVADRVAGISRNAPDCLTQQAFYRVRRALTAEGVPRSAVSPDAALSTLVPLVDRHRVWARLGHRVATPKWPALQHSPVVDRLIWYPGFVLGATIVLLTFRAIPTGLGFGLGLVIAGMPAIALSRIARSAAVHFAPPGLAVGDVARLVAAQGPVPARLPGTWSRDEVANVTRALIIRELGVWAFSDDDDFVHDLGAG